MPFYKSLEIFLFIHKKNIPPCHGNLYPDRAPGIFEDFYFKPCSFIARS